MRSRGAHWLLGAEDPVAGTPYEGAADCGGDRPRWLGGDIWGHEDESRSLSALIASVVRASFEVVPMDRTGAIDWARYGGAGHRDQPIQAGANDVLLRLPATYEAAGGNTGGIQGTMSCDGAPVGPENVTRVRAWSDDAGPNCGVQGLMASATELATTEEGTTYAVDYLAGGQCNASSQTYHVDVEVTCGGQSVAQEKVLEVSRGLRPRVDWAFP